MTFKNRKSLIQTSQKRKIKLGLGFTKLLPKWESFGWDRDISIIGTSDKNTAKIFGDSIYTIVPTKDEVYVCPKSDFNLTTSWDFFINDFEKRLLELDSTYLDGLKYDVNFRMNDINEGILRLYSISINDLDYLYKFEGEFDKLDYPTIFKTIDSDKDLLVKVNEYYKEAYGKEPVLEYFLSGIKEFKSIFKFLDYILDPVKNGFRKMKYTDLIKEIKLGKTNYEVWFPFDCILISNRDSRKLNR